MEATEEPEDHRLPLPPADLEHTFASVDIFSDWIKYMREFTTVHDRETEVKIEAATVPLVADALFNQLRHSLSLPAGAPPSAYAPLPEGVECSGFSHSDYIGGDLVNHDISVDRSVGHGVHRAVCDKILESVKEHGFTWRQVHPQRDDSTYTLALDQHHISEAERSLLVTQAFFGASYFVHQEMGPGFWSPCLWLAALLNAEQFSHVKFRHIYALDPRHAEDLRGWYELGPLDPIPTDPNDPVAQLVYRFNTQVRPFLLYEPLSTIAHKFLACRSQSNPRN